MAAAREPSEWYAAVVLTGRTETGFKGDVVRTFDDPEKTRFYCDKHRLALYPGAFEKRPADRSTVEVDQKVLTLLEREGKGQDLAHQARLIRWREEQGRYYNVGLWFDREETPRVGQYVHFSSGLDYRGEPEARRVMPLRPVDPGAPAEPQQVVFEMSRRTPNLGRIASLPMGPEAAQGDFKRLNAERFAREPAAVQKQWQTFDGDLGLRAIAEHHRKTDKAPEAEEPAQRALQSPPKVFRHVKGKSRAEVVERFGEDGTPEHVVLLTRQVLQPDGGTRTVRTVLGLDEARAISRANQEHRRRQAAQEARPTEREGHSVAKPGEDHTGSPAYARFREHLTWEEQRKAQHGIWMGAEPPKDHERVRWVSGDEYDLKTGAIIPKTGRIYPLDGPTLSAVPDQPLHVACRRTSEDGVRKIVGYTKDADLAATEVVKRNETDREEKRAFFTDLLARAEKDRSQDERYKQGLRDLISGLGPAKLPQDTPRESPTLERRPVVETRETAVAQDVNSRRETRDEAASRPDPNAIRYYVAGRVVDHNAHLGTALFRIEKVRTSFDALEKEVHRAGDKGLIIYRESYPEKPARTRLITVARGYQAAVDRKINDLEIQRDTNRTFIVARYDGDTSKIPRKVWFTDGEHIKPGEERIAVSLEATERSPSKSNSPVYLVIERAPRLPHLGIVHGHHVGRLLAHKDAVALEVRNLRKQQTASPEPPLQDYPRPPRSDRDWWRSEGQALQERKQQEQTNKPIMPR